MPYLKVQSRMRLTLVLAALLLAAVAAACAQNSPAITVNVVVPGNTLGNFGNPSCCSEPYIPALAAPGPGTITVSYISGTVTDSDGIDTGPNGVYWNVTGNQFPLQEALGFAGGPVNNLDALIGVFVPQSRISLPGFTATDGAKNNTPVGIPPCGLVFIGTGHTFKVREAGTLFLGINDDNGQSNGGAFTVSVTFRASSAQPGM